MPYRYQNIQQIKQNNVSTTYYVNNIYPDVPYSDSDIYVITTSGDRLDLLANDIYKDASLWWIIASANGLPGDSLVPPIGGQLRIPIDIQSIINKYNSINSIR
jgi:hypothetical protein